MKFFVLAITLATFATIYADKEKDMEMDKDMQYVELMGEYEGVKFYDKKHNVVNTCKVKAYIEKPYFKIYECEKMPKTFGSKMYTTLESGGWICHGEVDPEEHPEMGYYKCVKGGSSDVDFKYEFYAKELVLYKYDDDSEVNKCDVKFYLLKSTYMIQEKNEFKNCETAIKSSDKKMYGKFQTKKYYCKAIIDPSNHTANGKMMCEPKYKPCYCMNPYYSMSKKEMKSMMKKKYKLIYFYKKVTHAMTLKAYCKCDKMNWDSEE